MPYSQRITSSGVLHHVVARGNNRQPVFREDGDYQHFLDLLLYVKSKWPFQLFAYCLMTNHIHLLIRPLAHSTISKIMHMLLRMYAKHYNEWNRCEGHLWKNRFKSRVITDELYALRALIYIDRNPVRAGMCSQADLYPWSSAKAHVRGSDNVYVDAYTRLAAIGSPGQYGELLNACADESYPQTVSDTGCG